MRLAIYIILALVALQRLVEVAYAERNTRALLARGAVEIGRAHYPLIVLLHAAWLAAIVVLLPADATIHWIALAIFIALQLARVWVIATLGPFWTTRIITLEGAPLVRKGPYRFVRHPNYLVVAGEIAALPLAFGEIWVAVAFTVLNAAMLAWRIRQEDAALAIRRARAPANAV
ncbi:MAG TPA: isoprenylcysteine carboxylmethyltransferase family protein [Rhizomicrobium sp.]|nr:isoprenylcysteine carboxylmethyltransferase family protein [Rhizomicrobium sp.]